VQILRRVDRLKSALSLLRGTSGTVALVPTMGALHAGHMQLVREARGRADHVVVSIFVNPLQFGANEDLDRYQRQEETDAAMLSEAGVAVLWAPPASEVYPKGFQTNVSVGALAEGLCGAVRPGHFDGVATIVAKLFNQVRPDIAIFGEKDYQQLQVIKAMTRDLDLGVDVIGVPTVREKDGLALSSRNAYLSAEARRKAGSLPKAMRQAAGAIEKGGAVDAALETLRTALFKGGFASIDYAELRDADTLAPMTTLDRPGRLLVAARIAETRLIDNMPVVPPG